MKKKILIGICIFFVILIISVFIFLRTAFVKEKVRLIAESQMQKLLNREVSVGRITGNLLRGIRIDGVSVAKYDKLSEGKLIEIDEITAKYSLLNLLRRRLVIDDVKVFKPHIWVEMNEKGELNLPQIAKSTAEPAKKPIITVILSNAEIISGTVAFEDKRDSLRAVAQGIEGKVESYTLSNDEIGYSGNIGIYKTDVDFQKVSKTIFNLTTQFETAGTEIKLSDLQLRMGDSHLQAKGDFKTGDVLELNLQAQSHFALSDAKDFTPQLKRLDGMAELEIEVSGKIPEKKPDILGVCKVNIPDMHVNDLAISNVNVEANFTEDIFDLANMSAGLGKGVVKASGTAQLADGKLSKYDGAVKLSELDVERIITALNGTEVPISGILNGEITVNGTKPQPGGFDAEGQMILSDTSVKIAEKTEGSTKVSATKDQVKKVSTRVANIGTVKATLDVKGEHIGLNVSKDKTFMDLKGTLKDDGMLDLAIEMDGIDAGEITSIATGTPSVFGVGKVNATASMKIVDPAFRASMGLKEVKQRTDLIKGIDDLRVQAEVSMPNIKVAVATGENERQEIKIGTLTGTMNMVDDRLKVDKMILQLDDSSSIIEADVQIKDVPLIDAKLTLDSLKVEDYTGFMGSSQTADSPFKISGGFINGEIDVKGTPENIDGEGIISVTELSVGDRAFDPIDLPIEIESSVVRIPELIISTAGEKIKAICEFSPKGDYKLLVDSSPIDISGLYSDFVIKAIAPASGSEVKKPDSQKSLEMMKPGGTIQLHVSGIGNIKSPSFEGSLNLNDISYNGEYFGNGECLFSMADNKAHVDLSFLERALTATLDSGIKEPFPFSAKLELSNFDTEPALNIAGVAEKIDLYITGDINVAGEGLKPMDIYVDGLLRNISLNAVGHRWSNDVPVRFGFADRQFSMKSFEMKGESGNISLTGGASITGQNKIQKIGLNFGAEIRDFDLSIASKLIELPEPISGKFNCALIMNGDARAPIIALRMDSPRIGYDQINVDNITSSISYREGLLKVEKLFLNIFDGEAKFIAEVPINLDLMNPPKPEQLNDLSANAVLNVSNVDLRYIPLVAPDVAESSGKVDNVDFKINGSITQPNIDGTLSLKDIYIRMKSFPTAIEKLKGNVAIRNVEPKSKAETTEYEASLGVKWMIDKGSYNTVASVRIPRSFIDSMMNKDFKFDILNPEPDINYPEFNFDMNIQNGQIGSVVKDMLKDIPMPVDGSFSGKIRGSGSIQNPRGDVIIDSLDLTVNEQKIRNRDKIHIALADRSVKILNFDLATQSPPLADQSPGLSGYIKASGKASIDKVFELDFSAKHLHPGLFSFLLDTPLVKSDTQQNRKSPAPVTLPKPTNGDIEFSFHSKGKLDSPIMALALTASDMIIPIPSSQGEVNIDRFLCEISYSNGILDIEDVNINTFGNDMDINGNLPLELSLMPVKVEFPEKDMDIKLAMNNFGLDFIKHFAPQIKEFNGSAKADIRLLGSPKDPRLTGYFTLSDADCNVVAIPEDQTAQKKEILLDVKDINLNIFMDAGKIDIEKTYFQIGEGRYEVYGNLRMGQKLEPQVFEVSFKAAPAKIEPFVSLAGGEIASQISGEINVDGKINGDFRRIMGKPVSDMLKSISGSIDIIPEGIKIDAASHRITNPKDISMRIVDGRLSLDSFKLVDVTSDSDEATSIGALGDWEIDGDKSFDASIYIGTKLISDLLRKPDLMSGKMGFKVEARGDRIRCYWPPEDMVGSHFTVQNAVIDTFEGEIIYKDQTINITKQISISAGENQVFIGGSIPLSDDPMEVRVDARMSDMGILSLVNSEITESAGRGSIGATITGNLKKLLANSEPVKYAGFCNFDNLSVNFERSYIKFEDIRTNLIFNSNDYPAVKITSLTGKLNDGDFALDVSQNPGIGIEWSQNTGYRVGDLKNLSFTMTDCLIEQPGMYSIMFSADPIRLTGSFDAPLLTGNVIVTRGEYVESLESLIQNLFSTREIGVKAAINYPLVKDLELDVNVQVPGNMWMNNSLISVQAEATAKARGSIVDPLVLAQARIIEGKFSYFGREFNITKGEFSNESEINPKYEIVAETEIVSPSESGTDEGSTTKVIMELKGSLKERYPPKFSVVGSGVALQPDMSQSEIISILALGTTPEAFLSRALSSSSPLLMEPAKWYFEAQAEKRFGFKEFQIQIDPKDTKETHLVAAKQLMEQISLTVDLSYSGQQWIGLQRDFGKHFAVAGKVSPAEGHWGFDLKLKQDFP